MENRLETLLEELKKVVPPTEINGKEYPLIINETHKDYDGEVCVAIGNDTIVTCAEGDMFKITNLHSFNDAFEAAASDVVMFYKGVFDAFSEVTPTHSVYNSFYAKGYSETYDSLNKIKKEKTTVIGYVFRVISLVYTLCIVVPVFLFLQVINAVFEILNTFTYHNFNEYPAPYDQMQANGVPFKYFGLFKVWLIIATPILMIFSNSYNGLKTIKF